MPPSIGYASADQRTKDHSRDLFAVREIPRNHQENEEYDHGENADHSDTLALLYRHNILAIALRRVNIAGVYEDVCQEKRG